MRQHVARTRLLRFLPLEAASSQLVVSSDLGELEASMAGICTVPRPRPVAWGSWAGISPPSIDLTDHGGGLVVAVGGRPRDAWAPLLRPPGTLTRRLLRSFRLCSCAVGTFNQAGSQLVQHHAPWRNLTSKHLDAGASHMRCTRCKVQPGAPTTVMHQGAGAHRW